MQVGVAGRHAATLRAHDKALLNQVRLQYVLDRAAFFADRG